MYHTPWFIIFVSRRTLSLANLRLFSGSAMLCKYWFSQYPNIFNVFCLYHTIVDIFANILTSTWTTLSLDRYSSPWVYFPANIIISPCVTNIVISSSHLASIVISSSYLSNIVISSRKKANINISARKWSSCYIHKGETELKIKYLPALNNAESEIVTHWWLQCFDRILQRSNFRGELFSRVGRILLRFLHYRAVFVAFGIIHIIIFRDFQGKVRFRGDSFSREATKFAKVEEIKTTSIYHSIQFVQIY